MKRGPAGILALAIAAAPVFAGGDAPGPEQARALAASLGKALKAELTAAMQSGGPIKAIPVCNARAPAIASQLSESHDMQVGRVSLKNRNPANAANDWQAGVLAQFEQRLAQGEDPATMEWQETVQTAGGSEFRYMKAIPTGAVCLACHGKQLAPPVAEEIARLYPQDKATGFEQGDLRGAFVVTRQFAGQ